MLQQTIEEQERYQRWHGGSRRAVTPRRLLQESDELLFWIEECLVQQVRIVPKADHYVVEVVYRAKGTRAEGLNPDLFVALDPGTSVPFRPHLQLAWLRAPPGLWAAGEGRQSTVQQAARASAETAC